MRKQRLGQAAIRYDVYRFSKKEWCVLLGKDVFLAALLALLFYDSLLALPPLLLLVPICLKRQKQQAIQKRLDELRMQFREGLLAVSAALGAGYSVENAFREALKDLYFLYPAECPILLEFSAIVNGIEMNRSIEELLYTFAGRSGLTDVETFAEVFAISKRTGGDIASVIQDTASRISDRVDVDREIETYLSAKKLEQRIMNVVPLAILVYVRMSAPDFLSGVYGTLPGILLMSVCLCIYGLAYLWSEKILHIVF